MQTCLVNLFHLDPARNGGASRVAKEFSRMLAGFAQANRLHVIFAVGWRFADEFPAWLGNYPVDVIPCLPEAGLTPLLKALQPDILVSPLFGMAPFEHPHDFPQVPHIVSMPDIALGLVRPDLFSAEGVQQRHQLYAQLHHASRIVAVSEYSRQCLIRHVGLSPQKVVVVPLAANHVIESQAPNPDLAISQPYVFYPANAWPYKRHALLVEIMREIWKVRPEVRLVLAGWLDAQFVASLIEHSCWPGEQIINLGYISSDSQLATLYRQAEALLFVSEYESFGMPLLEAMGNGCPVMCAPSTALPEVAGDAALYVNSVDPRDWAEAFLNELPNRRSDLVEKGFSRARMFTWERSHLGWESVLIEAGLRPISPNQDSREELRLSLTTVTQEMAVWSHHHTAQQEALEAKEREIQSLIAAARSKDRAIQTQHEELIAKENVIQSLLSNPKLE